MYHHNTNASLDTEAGVPQGFRRFQCCARTLTPIVNCVFSPSTKERVWWMPQFTMLHVLGREYGLSIPETQECARKLGLPWQSAVTKLNGNQVKELRPALEAQQDLNVWIRSRPIPELSESRDVVRVECGCCQLTLPCRGDLGEALCDRCRTHFEKPGESVDRKLERLGDHDERMRTAYVRAREAYHESRREVGNALQSRDDWREAAVRLVHDHIANGKGRCMKCKHPFPCEPVQIIRSVNYGFYLHAEKLAGFSDDEVGRHVNPRRYNDDPGDEGGDIRRIFGSR